MHKLELYAVMVMIEDSWVYVTYMCDGKPEPLVFNNSIDAEDYAEVWRIKDKGAAKVVIYKGE